VPIASGRLGLELDAALEPDAIIVNECLKSGHFVFESMSFGEGKRGYVGTSGSSLGWGGGAAVGVQLAQPDRQVALMIGDGSLMFGPQALWTMARYEVPVLTVVWNNRNYQTVRHAYHALGGRSAETGRYPGTFLGDPDIDFTALARSMGVEGELVAEPKDLRAALRRATRATRAGRPYLLDVLVAREGDGAESTWHQEFSLAATRERRA
jgi:benzoylformate decarboxylase